MRCWETYQRTKMLTGKCGKLPANKFKEIPWYTYCVYLIGLYVLRRKGINKDLNLKIH